MCTLAFIWVAVVIILGKTSVISVFTWQSSLICLSRWKFHRYHVPKTVKSVPETVNMKTFWFLSASFFSIFLGTKAHFWQRENIIRFFHSSLLATNISLALVDAGMENADHFGLFECIGNTFCKRLAFKLLMEFSHKFQFDNSVQYMQHLICSMIHVPWSEKKTK